MKLLNPKLIASLLVCMFLGQVFVLDAARDPVAKALSEKVQDAWISFAKTGNPEHPNLKPWPAYDADRRATMVLSKDSHSEEAPMDAQRKFWDNIL